MGEDEHAGFVGGDDVGVAVLVDVFDDKLAADAGGGIDQVGLEVGLVSVADELEPVEHGGIHGIDVAGGAMCPVAFAGDDVGESVAVDVGDLHGVALRKLHAANGGVGLPGNNRVVGPGPTAIGV